ncbi:MULTISPECIES: hypothetical protein [unclassified Streptomyces]|uniref:hypothetical protein n=1 Tax=unclassified Streptomyces TaxID=2593676 RepID=UPI0035DB677B
MRTPKSARNFHRKARHNDRTKNQRSFHITGSWNDTPDNPVFWRTRDPKEAKKVARSLAAKGAYVIAETHEGYGAWSTWFELDGPALVAEAAAAEATLTAGWPPAPTGYRPDADDRCRTWFAEQAAAEGRRAQARDAAEQLAAVQRARRRRLAAEASRDARRLMTPPTEVRPEHRRTARHITGAQR